MAKRYDRYEIEIIISLAFLILFLISTNFISGYSSHRAFQGQQKQFENAVNSSAGLIQEKLENNIIRWQRSDFILGELLQDLSILTGIDRILVTDASGAEIAFIGQELVPAKIENSLDVSRPLRDKKDRIIAYVTITAINDMYFEYKRLSNWDMIFRICGLSCGLAAAGYFIWVVLYPYRRIKREALVYNLDIKYDGKAHGIEYIVNTFKEVIRELEDKRSQLEVLYEDSEIKADSLARYNDYILGSITSGVVICDSRGIVTRFNRSAEDILNFFEKECSGKHYSEIFGHDHKLTLMLDDALIAGKVHSRREFEIERPDSEKLWLGCSSSMVNDESGEGMGAVLLMIDLTEIRRLQEISSYSEKMVSLGEMAAGLAHEIRNSFAAIVGFANLIKKSAKQEENSIQIINLLKNEAASAEILLSRFLNFARPLDVQPEPVDIEELVRTSMGNLSHPTADRINIVHRIEDYLPAINADPMLLRQALTNILLNACDAMPDGGEIIVEVKMEKKKFEGRHDELILSIVDSGTGIDPEIKSRIFDPFFTNKADGTGLGLALVKKIIVLHLGRINVHSKKGKGTRFTIYLPYCESEELVQSSKNTRDKATRILI